MSAPVSYASVMQLHDLYLKGTHKTSTAAIGKEDTKTLWFELNADLRTFLEAILKQDSGVTGIRMYMQQNPATQQEIDDLQVSVRIEDVSQLSVALVATSEDGGRQVDIEKTIEPMNHSVLCPTFCV